MPPTKMDDLIIFLPGIMGSALQKDGRDVWALSGAALCDAIRTLGARLRELQITDDDPAAEDLGDGIQAAAVLPGEHCIPGLARVLGYAQILAMLRTSFTVIPGTVGSLQPANFYPFPYDWRRDNRASAQRLARFIERQLPIWRDYTGNPGAKVILITHSMGGLVARYYTEALDGWRSCRALFTFGTPHRGALNALDVMCNGFRPPLAGLTEIVRSFRSVDQLLPIYPCIEVGDGDRRVTEIADLPGIDPVRAAQGLAFHRAIEAAVQRHAAEPHYQSAFQTIPVVGTQQPTYQSARFAEGRVTLRRQLPHGIDPLLADGDGTVPRLSAIPLELSAAYRDTFVAERHSALPNHAGMLQDLRERLRQMQVQGLEHIRGAELRPEAAEQAAIALTLAELYPAAAPVEIRAALINAPDADAPLTATIEAVGSAQPPLVYAFPPSSGDERLIRAELTPGLYRIAVQTRDAGPTAPPALHDLFEVAL